MDIAPDTGTHVLKRLLEYWMMGRVQELYNPQKRALSDGPQKRG
jgi:hypothetical protein